MERPNWGRPDVASLFGLGGGVKLCRLADTMLVESARVGEPYRL